MSQGMQILPSGTPVPDHEYHEGYKADKGPPGGSTDPWVRVDVPPGLWRAAGGVGGAFRSSVLGGGRGVDLNGVERGSGVPDTAGRPIGALSPLAAPVMAGPGRSGLYRAARGVGGALEEAGGGEVLQGSWATRSYAARIGMLAGLRRGLVAMTSARSRAPPAMAQGM